MDEEFKKYVKMKGMLPEGAVRQKMTNDGFAAADIDAFLSGQVTSLPPPTASGGAPPRPPMAQMLQQGAPLRTAPPKLAPKADRRMSLMEEIQLGSKLKAVVKDDTRQTAVKPLTGGGGLLGMLALEMSKRRFNMGTKQEDSDSDSGFSDSDSDSD